MLGVEPAGAVVGLLGLEEQGAAVGAARGLEDPLDQPASDSLAAALRGDLHLVEQCLSAAGLQPPAPREHGVGEHLVTLAGDQDHAA